jgi:DNA-binding transcriptional LysR family regulator
MNIKQLTAFREVMLCGSVSQAARNLHLTQPAISSALKGLEDEIGLKLFERRKKRLIAVPEAHYLLSRASDIIEHLSETKQNLRSLSARESGTLKIVAMPGPSVFLLPKLISQFTAKNGDVSVVLTTRSSLQVQRLIETQNYDLGIADLDADQKTDGQLINAQKLDSSCVCAVPANDPLAKKSVIYPSDLSGKPLATLHTNHSSYTSTKATFLAAGAEFNPKFEAQYFLPLFTFIEEGHAYSVVDKLSAESYGIYTRGEPRIAFRPYLPEVSLRFVLLTPSHQPLSMLAQAFCELWTETCTKIEASFSS